MQDIKDLNLISNPVFKPEIEKGGNQLDRQASPYICPISGLEMNGKFKFCFFWTCGCVMSERALKQFNEKVCAICQKPFTETDIVILNAVDEDLELMNTRREARQNLKKTCKKLKNKVVVPKSEEKEKEATTSHTETNDSKKLTSRKDVQQEKCDTSMKPTSECLFK